MCNMKYNVLPTWSHFKEIMNILLLPYFLFETVQLWRTFHSLFIPASVLLSAVLSFSLILPSMSLPRSHTNGSFNCCLSTLCEVLIAPHGATSLLSNNTHTGALWRWSKYYLHVPFVIHNFWIKASEVGRKKALSRWNIWFFRGKLHFVTTGEVDWVIMY